MTRKCEKCGKMTPIGESSVVQWHGVSYTLCDPCTKVHKARMAFLTLALGTYITKAQKSGVIAGR